MIFLYSLNIFSLVISITFIAVVLCNVGLATANDLWKLISALWTIYWLFVFIFQTCDPYDKKGLVTDSSWELTSLMSLISSSPLFEM